MNEEINKSFIEAEKEWESKIREIFDNYFSEYKSDYKKMAELMIVVKDRLENNLNDDELSMLYIDLVSQISWRSNENLNDDDFYDFCWLADYYCIEKESSD